MTAKKMPKKDQHSLAGQITIGLIGSGSFAQTIAEILEDDAVLNSIPGIKVVGWVGDFKELQPPKVLVNQSYFNQYPDCEALFRSCPDLDIAGDLTDDGSGLEALRRSAPIGVSLISRGHLEYLSDLSRGYSSQIKDLLTFQEARNTFLATMDESDDEILIVNKEGLILELNRKILHLVGGTRESYIGRDWGGLRNDLYGESARRFLKMVIEVGLPVSETHFDQGPDKQIQKFQIVVYPLKDRAGVIQGLIIVRRNITSKINIEHKLELAQKTAAVSNYSAYVAHEIRNPLTAIGGFAKRLHEQANLDAAVKEKTALILEEAERLTAFLNTMDLYQLNTAEAGTCNINEVAKDVAELMREGEAKCKKVELSLELSDNVPCVFGGYAVIKQCLINLVKNSVEAVGSHGNIIIRSRLLDGTVYLEVEDNGHGIPLIFQEKALEPFFSTKRGRNGLGLSTVRKLLGEIGGRLHLFSKPDTLTLASIALWPVPADGSRVKGPVAVELS